jgi:glycine cleavage system H protein
MSDHLEFRVDKFIFKVVTDRLYSEEGLWVMVEDKNVRIGVSDYMQQRSGDVAFAEIKPEGTVVKTGDELAVIETIKVNISLISPVAGIVTEINPAMEAEPDIINREPYGAGWLVLIEAVGDETDLKNLLKPQEYFAKIKAEAEWEVRNK